jgi:glycosyltransferase involved in cell wall biosynthesis
VSPDILIVTPWYPTRQRPFYGSFVRDWARALHDMGTTVEVVHLDNVVGGAKVQVRRAAGSNTVPLTHVVVPQPADASRAEMARVQAAAFSTLLPRRWPDVKAIHAHVTMPTGWAVAQSLPQDVHLLITEHATYLNQLFRQPETRGMYAAAVARADECLAVSETVAQLLRAAVPELGDRFGSLGNPVPFDRLPLEPNRRPGLPRWLYVGSFIERKGLHRLLNAFARAYGSDGSPMTLTLVGEGPMREELAARAVELGIADAVDLQPALPPEAMPEVYAAHDVLVHLSSYETFGMTVVEAIASGMPVVVTRCGGPEETLLHAADLGAVRYVPVMDDPEPVVDAWRWLRGRTASVPWPAARALLELRYSPAQVGRRLLARLGLPGPDPVSIPVRLDVVTFDAASERTAGATLALVRQLGVDATSTRLHDDRGIAGQLQRIRLARRPQAFAERARSLVTARSADLVAVDAFVGAALVGRTDDVPVVSLADRSRLWQQLGETIARAGVQEPA